MRRTRCYRRNDGLGPGYVCSACGIVGHRLWRQSHVTLDSITLLCALCAERDQERQLRRYGDDLPDGPGIGDLIPARPTPEGDTFWGHTSGDVAWWYRLPQYADAARELDVVRRERERFLGDAERRAECWLSALRQRDEARAALTLERARVAALHDALGWYRNAESILRCWLCDVPRPDHGPRCPLHPEWRPMP